MQLRLDFSSSHSRHCFLTPRLYCMGTLVILRYHNEMKSQKLSCEDVWLIPKISLVERSDILAET